MPKALSDTCSAGVTSAHVVEEQLPSLGAVPNFAADLDGPAVGSPAQQLDSTLAVATARPSSVRYAPPSCKQDCHS